MTDEPTERDVEALTEVLVGHTWSGRSARAVALDILRSDWFITRDKATARVQAVLLQYERNGAEWIYLPEIRAALREATP